MSAIRTKTKKMAVMRDQQNINLAALVTALKDITSENRIELLIGGIRLNNITVILRQGLASYNETRFRYTDLKDLLQNLVKEGILFAKPGELHIVKHNYNNKINIKK